MESLNDFLIQKPRPLPVIVAVDRSGSMYSNGKIDALNIALKDFINSLKDEDSNKAEVHIALFSFGGDTATCDIPFASINEVALPTYQANGRTPMGASFSSIKTLIEDKVQIPSRSYKPTIVLLTDGIPTDDYESPMNDLINEGRSSKAFRIAMAIGDDADHNMLSKFVSTPEYLVTGESARDIRKFFRFVTMSVTQRMKSQTPDMLQVPPMPDDDTLDFLMEQIISYIQATIPGDKPDNIPNQDYIKIFENDTIFICTVSDGLGSSRLSKDGAALACECVVDILKKENSETGFNALSDKITKKWEHLVEQNNGLIKDYRTTNSFISVFKSEKIILAGQLGDVMISLRIDGLFRHFETIEKEFSNETDCLGSGNIERYKIEKYEFGHSFDFLIATDGISDEIDPMKLEAFQNYLKNKFQDVTVEFRNSELKSEIETIMQDKNNDDKSLVYSWTNKK